MNERDVQMIEAFRKYEFVDACDLCGSRNIVLYFSPSDLVRCVDCGFLFVSPRPSLEGIVESYSDDNYYDGWIRESEGRLAMWQKRYHRIRPYLAPSSVILDYGAGIGTFLHLAKQDGHSVYGTEISLSAKKIALDQYSILLSDSDSMFTSQYVNYFHAITAWHVVEHVGSPTSLLSHFYDMLRPGGWCFIAVPNANAKPLKRLCFRHNKTMNFPRIVPGAEIHLSQFTEKTLTKLLVSTGFAPVYVGIDDHCAQPNSVSSLKLQLYGCIRTLTHVNYSPTIFVAARKHRYYMEHGKR